MVSIEEYREEFLFISLYVLLSWPPFLYLNREVLDAVLERLTRFSPLTVAWFVGAVAVVAGLLRGREGVDRYAEFLSAPTDLFSMLVGASYLLAAISWWAIPELVFYLGADVTLNRMLGLVLLCQAPMLLLLSLMIVVGKMSGG